MKYYIATYSAETRATGTRQYCTEAINVDPIDYFIEVKEKEEKESFKHYVQFALDFFTEITEEQYLKLNSK